MKSVPPRRLATLLAVSCLAMPGLRATAAVPGRSAQDAPRASAVDTGPPPPLVVATDQDYRIGARDVIEIRVDDAPELSVTAAVSADGTFLMPYLKRLKAEGKTTDELAGEVAEGLRGRYLKDPSVAVVVKQFNSRSFFVLGAVKRPGVYQVDGRPSLLKLLTVAGGPADNHGSTAIILREVRKGPAGAGDGEPEYSVRQVNINGIFRGLGIDGDETSLEPGDIVNVPPADVFFVAGEVFAPGQFALSEGTTLRQAMALAQGTTFNAASGDGTIFRTDPATGRREEIKVDIGAVMKNRMPDIPLIANDIVLVPNSKGKTVGNAILKALGIGMAQRGPYR